MSKREPQMILKTDERGAVLELGRDGKFAAKSNGWDDNRLLLEGDSFRTGSRTGAGVDPPAGGAVAGGRAGTALFRCRVGDVVIGCDAVT
jgi:hypothetical protein